MKLSKLLINAAVCALISTNLIANTSLDANANKNVNTAITNNGSQPIDDTVITTKVKGSIYGEKLFGNTNPPSVSVTTVNGVVTLEGTVTPEQNTQLLNFLDQPDSINTIEGVKRIDNHVTVESNGNS